MRVLHYHKHIDFRQGGVARAVADLSAVLAGAGHDVILATGGFDDPAGVWDAPGSPRPDVVELRATGKGARFTPAELERFRALARGADVVHLHALWTPSNLQAAGAARAAGVPYVVTLHGMLGRWSMGFGPLHKRLKKQAFMALGGSRYLRDASALHVACEEEQRQASDRIDAAGAHVVPLALDLSAFEGVDAPPREPGAPVRVVFLSRLHPVKGVELLIDACAQLAGEGAGDGAGGGAGLELIIAGTGDDAYERALRERARPMGDRCRFVGFVDGGQKTDLYRGADLFVLPSGHENFGLAWAEAMACGAPVIVTPEVGPSREIEDAGAGVVCPRTPDGLAGAMRGLIADEGARRALGRRGRAWVRQYLDPDRIAGMMERVYRSVASAPAGAGPGAVDRGEPALASDR